MRLTIEIAEDDYDALVDMAKEEQRPLKWQAQRLIEQAVRKWGERNSTGTLPADPRTRLEACGFPWPQVEGVRRTCVLNAGHKGSHGYAE